MHANKNNKEVGQEYDRRNKEGVKIIKILSSSVTTAEINSQLSKYKTNDKY